MYPTRIRRTASKAHPKFSIPLSDFRVDPRARYVESVCAVLIESRFGWSGSIEPWWDDCDDDLEELPEVDPRQLCDDPFDLMPACADEAAVFDDGVCMSSQGRKVIFATSAALRGTAFCFTQQGKESSGTRGSP